MAGASLALGIVSLFVWLYWLTGIPVSLCGVVVGIVAVARVRSRDGRSIAGLVMSSIGLMVSIVNFIIAMFTPVVY